MEISTIALSAVIGIAVLLGGVQQIRAQEFLSGRYEQRLQHPTITLSKARKERAPDIPKDVVLKTISPWTVVAQESAQVHLGCLARILPDSNGVSLSMFVPKNPLDPVVMTLDGADFKISGDVSTLGLVLFDDGLPLELFGRKVAPWSTELSAIDHKSDPDSLLHQFSKATKISVLLGELRYTTDLKGSGDGLKKLEECNSHGQAYINRKRFTDAQQAKTK